MDAIPTRFLPLLCAVFFTPSISFAEASDFDFLDIAYISQNSPDADGYGIAGSYRFYDDFFAEASYGVLSLDGSSPANLDGNVLTVGIGFIFGNNDTGSFFGKLAIVSEKAEFEIGNTRTSNTENGYQVDIGIRTNTSERSELNLTIAHRDLDIINGNLFSGQWVFDFTEPVSGAFTVTRNSITDGTGFNIGIRINF